MSAPGSRYEEYFGDVAELRGSAYGLLGSLFAYPGEEVFAELVRVAVGLRQSDLASDLFFFPRLKAVLDLLSNVSDEARLELEEEYVSLFVIGASQVACPPYESAYLTGGGGESGLVGVDVERAYAASGVSLVSPGELPDHAAIELAFLSVVCSQETQAWRAGRLDEAGDCLQREQAFLDDHVLRFLPAFVRRVSLACVPESFYWTLAAATHAFVVHDRDLIRTLTAAPTVRVLQSQALGT